MGLALRLVVIIPIKRRLDRSGSDLFIGFGNHEEEKVRKRIFQ